MSIEVDTGDEEISLVPNFVVETVARGSSLAEICANGREKIRRGIEHEMRRQQYLRREHESHCSTIRMPLPTPGALPPANWKPYDSTMRAALAVNASDRRPAGLAHRLQARPSSRQGLNAAAPG